MNNHRAWVAVALASILASVVGCSAADEVTNSVSCGQVCARYSDCDADYDVEGCTDRCESSVDISQNMERQLDRCDTCLDERSCSDCDDVCLGIVP